MYKIVYDIKNYISYLIDNYKLNISICDIYKSFVSFPSELLEYNIHSNEYCTLVKQFYHKKCLYCQKLLSKKLTNQLEPCSGKCFAGVYEYIFPISHNDKYLGYICCSGYQASDFNIKKYFPFFLKKFNLSSSNFVQFYKKNLSKNTLDNSLIFTLITPLQYMLEKLFCESTLNLEKNSQKQNKFDQILSYINEKYFLPITVNDIADEFFYSTSYLYYLFNINLNSTPSKYLKELRLKKSKQLLKTTSRKIIDIAYQVGFNDSNYFSTQFKSAYKISPKSYRISKQN